MGEEEIYSDGDGVVAVKIYFGLHRINTLYSGQEYASALITTDISNTNDGIITYPGNNPMDAGEEYNSENAPYSAYATKYNNLVYLKAIDIQENKHIYRFVKNASTGLYEWYGGSSAIITNSSWVAYPWGDLEYVPLSTKNPRQAGEMKKVVYGNVSIPVQWTSTRYNKTYQDTFEIDVMKEE